MGSCGLGRGQDRWAHPPIPHQMGRGGKCMGVRRDLPLDTAVVRPLKIVLPVKKAVDG